MKSIEPWPAAGTVISHVPFNLKQRETPRIGQLGADFKTAGKDRLIRDEVGRRGREVDDPTLPAKWTRRLKQRKHGKQQGRWDVYIYSPDGVKFASKKKLISYFTQ